MSTRDELANNSCCPEWLTANDWSGLTAVSDGATETWEESNWPLSVALNISFPD